MQRKSAHTQWIQTCIEFDLFDVRFIPAYSELRNESQTLLDVILIESNESILDRETFKNRSRCWFVLIVYENVCIIHTIKPQRTSNRIKTNLAYKGGHDCSLQLHQMIHTHHSDPIDAKITCISISGRFDMDGHNHCLLFYCVELS